MPSRPARKPTLTIATLQASAGKFAATQSRVDEPKLFGVTDGKAVGTYLEGKFVQYLAKRYSFDAGSAAKGIDLPGLQIDIKTTSVKQPKRPAPFDRLGRRSSGWGTPCWCLSIRSATTEHAQPPSWTSNMLYTWIRA